MKNPVQQAIDALGGRLEDLAVVCRVSATGVWQWLQKGKIHNAQHAVMAAEECARRGHPEITVARLAGIEEGDAPPSSTRASTASRHPTESPEAA